MLRYVWVARTDEGEDLLSGDVTEPDLGCALLDEMQRWHRRT